MTDEKLRVECWSEEDALAIVKDVLGSKPLVVVVSAKEALDLAEKLVENVKRLRAFTTKRRPSKERFANG